MPRTNKTIQQIRQHSRQLVRELDVVKGVYLDTPYTFTQCHVLFELASHQSLSLMQIADILLIDKSNTSRTVKKLVELGLVKSKKSTSDSRQKFFSLTAKGQQALEETIGLADQQVNAALLNLSPPQQQAVIEGLALYSSALRKGRLQQGYSIRKIKKSDNPSIAEVIRSVMTEFDAVGEGYSIGDLEVDDIYTNYKRIGSAYYVIEYEGEVCGGGGIGPLKGGAETVCELRKMFYLPSVRGFGMGKRLLMLLLDEARKMGYQKCYLETLQRMSQAQHLYEQVGFVRRDQPLGDTGHCSCDRWYEKSL